MGWVGSSLLLCHLRELSRASLDGLSVCSTALISGRRFTTVSVLAAMPKKRVPAESDIEWVFIRGENTPRELCLLD